MLHNNHEILSESDKALIQEMYDKPDSVVHSSKEAKVVVNTAKPLERPRLFSFRKRYFFRGGDSFANFVNFEEKFPKLMARPSDINMSELIEGLFGVE